MGEFSDGMKHVDSVGKKKTTLKLLLRNKERVKEIA